VKHPRFRIEIPLFGKLYLLINVGLGLAAINTGNNLLYLVFGAMLGFIILSGILSNITLSSLSVSAFAAQDIYGKETAWLRLHFENHNRWLPSYAITCFPDAAQTVFGTFTAVFEERIAPKAYSDQSFSVIFTKRGWASLPPFRMETLYPFGLLKKYMRVTPRLNVLVYPQLIDVSWVFSDQNLAMGDTLSMTQILASTNPYGIREFRQGDSMRHVHWKSSAKRGHLHIKEFEGEQMPFVYIQLLLDSHVSDPSHTERAISLCASLIKHFVDQTYAVHLLSGEHIYKNLTKDTIHAAFIFLATLKVSDQDNNAKEPKHLSPLLIVSSIPRSKIIAAHAHIVSTWDHPS